MKEKANVIRNNKAQHEGSGAWKAGMSLQQMMFWEKENNVANLNGSNNKKILPKESKGTW